MPMEYDDDLVGSTETISVNLPGGSLSEVMEAIRGFQNSIAEQAFRAGFKAGWDQASKAIEDALAKGNVRAPMPRLNNDLQVKAESAVGAKSTGEMVFRIISEFPGLRGVEIVDKLERQGTPVLERTVRTVLWRLKNADRIKVVDGRWFTPDSAPSAPLSQEEEANDAAAS